MKHKNDKQKERKQAFEQACRTGVYKEIFENKPDNTIKSMYENLLKRKRAHNKAAISGGTGTSPPPLDAESAALVSQSNHKLACLCWPDFRRVRPGSEGKIGGWARPRRLILSGSRHNGNATALLCTCTRM